MAQSKRILGLKVGAGEIARWLRGPAAPSEGPEFGSQRQHWAAAHSHWQRWV